MVSPVINILGTKHSGVSGIPTQLLVLHSGETPLRGGYAQSLTINWGNLPVENGGPYASWHWFIDPIACVRMIEEQYAAWHATWANSLSEGFEQAGYARFSHADWTTAEGMKQMDNLAWVMAQRCTANGIPARWLTTAEVNAVKAGNRSIKGLCTHAQVDPASRTDPGSGYPYNMLLERIHAYMGGLVPASGNNTPTNSVPLEDDMSAADVAAIRGDLNTVHEAVGAAEGRVRADLATVHTTIIADVGGQLAGLREAVAQSVRGPGSPIDMVAVEAASKRGAEAALATMKITVEGGGA